MANPGQFLFLQFLGMLALGFLALALVMLYAAIRRRTVTVLRGAPHELAVDAAASGQRIRPAGLVTVDDRRWTAKRRGLLALALVLLLLLFAGRFLGVVLLSTGEQPPGMPADATTRVINGPSGAALSVIEYGPVDGPLLLFTHGWGNDHRQWVYLLSALPAKYRVVVWDLPGLGASTSANDYALSTMADDLNAIVAQFPGRPMILVGHSIGGMLDLELAKNHPERFGSQVRGLVEVDTTYTNPVMTKKDAETSAKLQKPVFEPLLHVIDWISPVARAGGWLAYESGMAHAELAFDSFTGSESWAQLDHMARYSYQSSPGVIARGTLGMLHWDASQTLARVNVPTLVIVGKQDTTTLPAAAEHIAENIPSAELVAVDRAAHLGPIEQYKRYAEELDRFATKVLGVPAK